MCVVFAGNCNQSFRCAALR